MGVSIKSKNQHWHLWICIIPNSQLVGIPYKPDDPTNWTLELYIKKSGLMLWVVVAVVSCLIATGGAIAFFSWREKREDKLIKKETAHLFSFDAL
jgi:integrin alpha FG-GAP repeat containing protein 1